LVALIDGVVEFKGKNKEGCIISKARDNSLLGYLGDDIFEKKSRN